MANEWISGMKKGVADTRVPEALSPPLSVYDEFAATYPLNNNGGVKK